MASIVFIAVQCCQCSTMQAIISLSLSLICTNTRTRISTFAYGVVTVFYTIQVKQKKKSSNKWTCVVCNQKQSVLKVFAQSYMAKDVRKVVQTFNMSRQLAHQNQSLVFHQQTLVSESPKQVYFHNQNKKRTDWTEYIDPEDEEADNHNDNDNARSLGM